MVAIQQTGPSPLPPLDPGVHPRHTPAWTDLVQEENGKYKQTSQRPELNACLGAAVKCATANLVLFDAFPSLHVRDKWALCQEYVYMVHLFPSLLPFPSPF